MGLLARVPQSPLLASGHSVLSLLPRCSYHLPVCLWHLITATAYRVLGWQVLRAVLPHWAGCSSSPVVIYSFPSLFTHLWATVLALLELFSLPREIFSILERVKVYLISLHPIKRFYNDSIPSNPITYPAWKEDLCEYCRLPLLLFVKATWECATTHTHFELIYIVKA